MGSPDDVHGEAAIGDQKRVEDSVDGRNLQSPRHPGDLALSKPYQHILGSAGKRHGDLDMAWNEVSQKNSFLSCQVVVPVFEAG